MLAQSLADPDHSRRGFLSHDRLRCRNPGRTDGQYQHCGRSGHHDIDVLVNADEQPTQLHRYDDHSQRQPTDARQRRTIATNPARINDTIREYTANRLGACRHIHRARVTRLVTHQRPRTDDRVQPSPIR